MISHILYACICMHVVRNKIEKTSYLAKLGSSNIYVVTLLALFFGVPIQKKLSNSEKVSRVLNYIPELQRQVQRLVQKKEDLVPLSINSCISRLQADDVTNFQEIRQNQKWCGLEVFYQRFQPVDSAMRKLCVRFPHSIRFMIIMIRVLGCPKFWLI